MSGFASAAPVAPSELSVFLDRTSANKADPSNDTYVFLWNDNSTDETGFAISYTSTTIGQGTLTTVGSGTTSTTGSTGVSISITGGLPVGTVIQWQVASSNASGTSTASAITTASTTTVQTAQLVAPASVAVTATNETTVNVTWTDASTSAEGDELWVSTNGGTYTYLGDVLFYQTKSINIPGLAAGTSYQAKLRAYQEPATTGGARTYSAYSSPSTSIGTKDGFTSRTYEPITYNQAFSYQAVVSTVSARNSWNITGLPTGLTFNSSTGIVSGTPSVTGVFVCPMTATFANGWTTNTTLTLRIVRAAGLPVVDTTITGQSLANGGNTSVSLTGKFSDPDSESAVRVVTNIGTMDFILYNTATPQTVTNFLSYVNNASSSGNYNGAVFHRSIPGFIVQGGGFKVQSAPNNFTSILTTASPTNEPGISNLRGTVAMAKVGSDPNSATDQFFVNLADNSSNLDNQNGGFTAFARVAGNGMTVADAMAGKTTVSATVNVDGSSTTSLTDWPLTSPSASMDTTKVISITSVAPVAVLSYSVTGNTNPTAVSASISGGTNVQINGLAGGQSDVTVTATDLDGSTVSQTFTVMVSQAPLITSSAPSATGTVGAAYNFNYTASGFPAPTFTVTTGALPPGLSLSSAGVISGTATTAGLFTGTVTAANSVSTNPQNFSIVIDKATATVSLGSLSQTYDGTARAATATTTPAGKTVIFTYNGSSTVPTNAGTYEVVGTIVDNNYAGSSSPQNLIVAKAAGTVSLGSLSQTYDGTARIVTATTTPAGKTVTFTYNGSGTPPTNAGTYVVVGTMVDDNYAATASNDFIVAQAAASVTLGNLAQNYDGSPKSVTVTTNPAGLAVSITYNGSSSVPTAQGSYAVIASITDSNNYSSSPQTGTLIIGGQTSSSWKSQHFSEAQISSGLSADNADPDGDGLKNFVEYALGLDPLSKNVALQPTIDSNGLTLMFTRPKNLPDVTYAAQSSDTLGSWNSVTLEVISDDGQVQTVRARDSLVTGNPNRRFMRLIFGTP
jgi:YD repeat-containing protein